MKNKLHQLLTAGKTGQALAALQNTAALDRDDQDLVRLLAARYAENERQQHAGTLAAEVYRLERNKINAALLAVIEQLPEHTEKIDEPNPADRPPTIIQQAEKIYNIEKIDNANFS